MEKKTVLPRSIRTVLEIMVNDKISIAPLFKSFYIIPYNPTLAYTEEQRKEKGIALKIDSEEFGPHLIISRKSDLVHPQKKDVKKMEEHFKKRKEANWVRSTVSPCLLQTKKMKVA